MKFVDQTGTAGISWQPGENYIYASSWIDFNQDGLLDLVLAPHWIQPGPNQLEILINQGDGTFVDVAPLIQTDYGLINTDNHGMAWADFDNDGDQDVAFHSGGPTFSTFYVNEDGQLVEKAAYLGVDGAIGERTNPENKNTRSDNEEHSHGTRGRAATWADVNNDGLLDLFHSNWVFTEAYKDSPIVTDLVENQQLDQTALHLQTSDHRFSQKLNFTGGAIYSAKVTPGDLLVDNVLDLIFAQDYRESASVYKSTGGGNFQKQFDDLSLELDLPLPTTVTDVLIGDFTGNLNPEILIVYQDAAGQPVSPVLLSYDTVTQRYVNIAEQAGLNRPLYGGSVVAADFDNDRYLDIYINTFDVDTNTKLYRTGTSFLYRNEGNGTFTRVSDNAGAHNWSSSDEWVSTLSGMTGNVQRVFTADYDLNGFMDLFISNMVVGQGEDLREVTPSKLFANEGNNNGWLEIDLEGTISNRDAYGAKVYLTTADGKTQYREVFPNQGFGQNASRVHFGLGSHDQAQEIRIEWPSGLKQTLNNVTGRQIIKVVESYSTTPVIQDTFKVGNNENNILLGTEFHDTLVGQDGNDSLLGTVGNDALNGGRGNDTLNGDVGNDLLSGGADNDLLVGGDGNDVLNGGRGIDTLDGGVGNDVLTARYGWGSELTGGPGADRFFFNNPEDGLSYITDFTVGEDSIEISKHTFGVPKRTDTTPPGTLDPNRFILGNGDSPIIPGTFVYDQSAGHLWFDSFEYNRFWIAILESTPTISSADIFVV